jgi:hypothetical protein
VLESRKERIRETKLRNQPITQPQVLILSSMKSTKRRMNLPKLEVIKMYKDRIPMNHL